VKFNRLELLRILRALSPALGNSRDPILSRVWFDGEHVSAFNDMLGIKIVFPTEFTGGVLGEKLIGVLQRSRARTVYIRGDGDDALIKIGNARITLSRQPIDDWLWKPEVPKRPRFPVTIALRDAIAATLLTVGSANVLNPEQRGITIIQNGKAADLYSTDAVSMSWVRIDSKVCESGTRLILPTPFCERLTSLKSDAELRFNSHEERCPLRWSAAGCQQSV
jgi:hypothetical protein